MPAKNFTWGFSRELPVEGFCPNMSRYLYIYIFKQRVGVGFPSPAMAASSGGLGLAAAVLCASKWQGASSRFSAPDEDDAWDFDACCDEQAEAEPCNHEDFGYDTCGCEDGEAELLSSFAQTSPVPLPLLDSPSAGFSQVCGQNNLCISTFIYGPLHL